MKFAIYLKLILCSLFASLANAAVTSEQLGSLLLEENYQGISLNYLAYSATGVLGSNKSGPSYHPGIDYPVEVGKAVYSPVSGVVGSTDSTLGRVSILIDNTKDYFIFMHLSRIDVKKGVRVTVGDTIGLSGKQVPVGWASVGPHVHVEVRTGDAVGAWYFTSPTLTGVNKAPYNAANLDLKTKMTYVFNMYEKKSSSPPPPAVVTYPGPFASSLRYSSGTSSFFNGNDAFRYYLNKNYLYFWTNTSTQKQTLWYRVNNTWYNTNSSVDAWYTNLGGK